MKEIIKQVGVVLWVLAALIGFVGGLVTALGAGAWVIALCIFALAVAAAATFAHLIAPQVTGGEDEEDDSGSAVTEAPADSDNDEV